MYIKTKDVPIRSRNIELRKYKFHVLGVIQGVHHTPEVWCFFKIFKIQPNKGCPAVRFEYKMASERYLVADM